ncbi:MAG: alkaline phosphatase family protein [Actinobacteria bacterium]|nr:alkaline phosphatase family protein [Actinomycetota bacterium]
MAELVLGPMVRYVSGTEATVWVETDTKCQVDVLGRQAPSFHVNGHHYAIVPITGLEPGSAYEYEVLLDGERRWPVPDHGFPASQIRTLPGTGPIKVVFGSCRVTAPHAPPYTLSPDKHKLGVGVDALYALGVRLCGQDPSQWPAMLLMIGDQVYADHVSPETLEFIRSRRDVTGSHGDEVADFAEYAQLYREAWKDPMLRWLFSAIPTAMIFDDHDVHDDWNTSEEWVAQMRAQPWWQERITSALASYWIYQHIGNFPPADLERDPLMRQVMEADDGGPVLRAFAADAEREGGGSLWSFSRDLGGTRLVVLDGREGRVLNGGRREMLDENEWSWVEKQVSGDFDHLLLANTLPVLLPPTVNYLEGWSEAVCAGAWGQVAARFGERIRRALDLEHWAAFQDSYHRLIALIGEVGAGRRGSAPASITLLGGDVHHAYLEEVEFGPGTGVQSKVYQAVCSPFRNQLGRPERILLNAGYRSRLLGWFTSRLAHAVKVRDPEIGWRLVQEPIFDNQLATLRLDGRHARLTIEGARGGNGGRAVLEPSLDRQLS